MIQGLSHITFVVRDIGRTAALFEKVFDAKQVYHSGDKTFSLSKEKFFLIGGLWLCVMEGEPPTQRTYNHVAFQIQESEMEGYIKRIEEAGAEIKPPRPRVQGEGASVYFYDYDNHLFELHTGTLEQRLARYAQDD